MDVLKNKSYKEYRDVSRYSVFPYYYHSVDNKYVYGTTAQTVSNAPHTVVTVERGDTLDSLSLKYYNTPVYYWVIADFNRIQDPFKPLEVGQSLRIPAFTTIAFDI